MLVHTSGSLQNQPKTPSAVRHKNFSKIREVMLGRLQVAETAPAREPLLARAPPQEAPPARVGAELNPAPNLTRLHLNTT